MSVSAPAGLGAGLTGIGGRCAVRARRDPMAWSALPVGAQVYVAAIIGTGAWLMLTAFPSFPPRPLLFASLVLFSSVTSTWKVNLPLSRSNGSTLSVSYAADLVALLLLGPDYAMIVAVAGAWTQCTYRAKQKYPWYRTVFSMAGEAITIQATGVVYLWLSGGVDLLQSTEISRTVVAVIATYYVVNTGLVAIAIALSTGQSTWRVWHDVFLWSGCQLFW